MSPEVYKPDNGVSLKNLNDGPVFDFGAWEEEVKDIDLEEQAKMAFDGLLTFETEDETEVRTVQDIKNDIISFMSNPEIIQMQQVVEYAALQFEQFCNHNHLEGDISSDFSSIFNTNQESLDLDVNKPNSENADTDSEEYTIDPNTGLRVKRRKKNTKKKKKITTWMDLFQ